MPSEIILNISSSNVTQFELDDSLLSQGSTIGQWKNVSCSYLDSSNIERYENIEGHNTISQIADHNYGSIGIYFTKHIRILNCFVSCQLTRGIVTENDMKRHKGKLD